MKQVLTPNKTSTTTNHLTTSQGHPVSGNQNSLTSGEYGPILIQDFHLIDKLAKFDRERIPERVVHAKGAGAHGFFEVTHDVTKYCKAKVFENIGKKTPVFVRFSTVGGEKGSADTERDPRGFAIKFYTEEGNWDMVGNNTPVFFIRDPIKFPDFIHTQKRNPRTNCKDPDMFWDFLSQTPESAHQVSILFSDRGTPYGYRNMNGYSSHTFRWVNDQGEGFWVKLHFKTDSGIRNMTAKEADEYKMTNADFATEDLYKHIENGGSSTWSMGVQVMPEADAASYKWNVFDVTKVWPHGDYPLIPVGKLVLNRNPKNYFAEVEQSAFAPAHLVPGMEPSFDKMLQGRLFSYPDTHRHRLGANYDQIPINCPYRSRVSNGQADGPMVVNDNGEATPNYEPNSTNPFTFSKRAHESNLPVRGRIMRYKPAHPNCDFAQPGALYRKVMTPKARANLVSNLHGHIKNASRVYQERQLRIFGKCDPEYGANLASKLGVPMRRHKL
jgi:catalase